MFNNYIRSLSHEIPKQIGNFIYVPQFLAACTHCFALRHSDGRILQLCLRGGLCCQTFPRKHDFGRLPRRVYQKFHLGALRRTLVLADNCRTAYGAYRKRVCGKNQPSHACGRAVRRLSQKRADHLPHNAAVRCRDVFGKVGVGLPARGRGADDEIRQ